MDRKQAEELTGLKWVGKTSTDEVLDGKVEMPEMVLYPDIQFGICNARGSSSVGSYAIDEAVDLVAYTFLKKADGGHYCYARRMKIETLDDRDAVGLMKDLLRLRLHLRMKYEKSRRI